MSYNLPPILLNLGVITGILLVSLSLLLFFAGYFEKLSILLLGQILSIVLAIFLFLYGSMVRYSSTIYDEVIRNNCHYILKIINFALLSCEKYSENPCEKQFRALVWENELKNKNSETCLNNACCVEIQQEITLSLEFLMLLAFLSCILLIFSWLAGQGLVKKIEKFGKTDTKHFDIKLFSLVVVIILLSLAGLFAFENHKQKLTQNSPVVKVINGEILQEKFLPSPLCENFNININISDQINSLTIYSDQGFVFPNFYSGKLKSIQKQMKNSVFCAYFPSSAYHLVLNYTTENDSTGTE